MVHSLFDPQADESTVSGPHRSRGRRLLFILTALVIVVMGAGVVVAVIVKQALRGPVASVYIGNSFLHDLRDAHYDKALNRLCPQAQREAQANGFISKASQVRAAGHGIATYDVPVTFDRETLGAHSAQGTVTFTDGRIADVDFDIEWQGGSACIAAGYSVVTD